MNNYSEIIKLSPALYLQASSQNFRLHRILPWETAPVGEMLLDVGDSKITRQLMAGALYAGISQPNARNDEIEKQQKPYSLLLNHIYSLACSYQTTHATPPTMRRVADSLEAAGQQLSASYCRKVAKEESGHDTLALNDLNALGLPAQDFVERLRPKSSLAKVALFNRYADSDQPISVLGYAYVLERMSLFITEPSILAIEQLIPKGIKATRCLRVHSAVGSDAGHVAESIDFIATLSARDRLAIALAAYETIATSFDAYIGDDAMIELLEEFGWSIDKFMAAS